MQVGKLGYLVLEFLEHQWVWFFQYLLIEPGLPLHVDLRRGLTGQKGHVDLFCLFLHLEETQGACYLRAQPFPPSRVLYSGPELAVAAREASP